MALAPAVIKRALPLHARAARRRDHSRPLAIVARPAMVDGDVATTYLDGVMTTDDPTRIGFRAAAGSPPVEWVLTPGLTGYPEAVSAMEARAAAIAAGAAPERVWLVEHPSIYTAGTSAHEADLLDPGRFPVYRTGRGGQFTYHGPGQRVVYTMLDLGRRGADVRRFVGALEAWTIATLAEFGIVGERREGRVGIWVRRPDRGPEEEDKIAAIGIRMRRWVSFHGLAINVAPALDHFSGIVPCGISRHGVTSLTDLGVDATMADVDKALRRHFEAMFGPSVTVDDPVVGRERADDAKDG